MGLIVKLIDALREQSCLPNTRNTYCHWVRKFYGFVKTPASSWTGVDVRRWMIHLSEQNYSASSRKQALNAIAFVFRHVLKTEMGNLQLPPMPRIHAPLKLIPTREEIGRIFSGLRGQSKLMAGLMYGSGLRVNECCQLRVQDLDFAALTVRVNNGKGDKSRLTVLPVAMVPSLQRHIAWRKSLHDLDLSAGSGLVELPGRLAEKFRGANREFRWQWLFPSTILRGQYRWHATDESVAKQMRAAVKSAGIVKRVTPHTLRHAFATHAMRSGNDVRTVQELLGHEHLETTEIYLHADGARGVSPMDASLLRLPCNPQLTV